MTWNVMVLETTAHPKYLGVTLDRTHTQHDDEGGTRNNLIKKLFTSKWGTYASTILITALALCNEIHMSSMGNISARALHGPCASQPAERSLDILKRPG